jgi:S-methylmethionine-dependent homocysteine/selenocysteine methylase
MGGRLHLADGGVETVMVFFNGLELPQFASFPLLSQPEGRAALRAYFEGFLGVAEALGAGFILDTLTWRASAGWAGPLNMSAEDIDEANRQAVAFARELRDRRPAPAAGRVLINGILGPHGDAYAPDRKLSADEAQAYHSRQIAVLAGAGVDLVSAMTISSTGESIGITRAARAADVPVVLSFTVETDGRLITGQPLDEAIAETDAATGAYPAFYGVNCAHPDHFAPALTGEALARVGLIRANASRQSHAELDEASELDDGDPEELGRAYAVLRARLPGLRVLGGCCGTDLRHVAAIGNHVIHRH